MSSISIILHTSGPFMSRPSSNPFQCEAMISREVVTQAGSWTIGWQSVDKLTGLGLYIYWSLNLLILRAREEMKACCFWAFVSAADRPLCTLRLHLLWFCVNFLQRDLQDASEFFAFFVVEKDENPWFTCHCRISSQRLYDSESCISILYADYVNYSVNWQSNALMW